MTQHSLRRSGRHIATTAWADGTADIRSLNAYRSDQSLLNLAPGATPTQFQSAGIDALPRPLRTPVAGSDQTWTFEKE